MPVINQRFAKVHSESETFPAAIVEVWEIAESALIDAERYIKQYGDRWVVAMNSAGQEDFIPKNSLWWNFGNVAPYPFNSENSAVYALSYEHLKNALIHYNKTKENILDHQLRTALDWLPVHQQAVFWKAIRETIDTEGLSVSEQADQIKAMFTDHFFRLGRIKVRFVDNFDFIEPQPPITDTSYLNPNAK
jgi:hypothetical protein